MLIVRICLNLLMIIALCGCKPPSALPDSAKLHAEAAATGYWTQLYEFVNTYCYEKYCRYVRRAPPPPAASVSDFDPVSVDPSATDEPIKTPEFVIERVESIEIEGKVLDLSETTPSLSLEQRMLSEGQLIEPHHAFHEELLVKDSRSTSDDFVAVRRKKGNLQIAGALDRQHSFIQTIKIGADDVRGAGVLTHGSSLQIEQKEYITSLSRNRQSGRATISFYLSSEVEVIHRGDRRAIVQVKPQARQPHISISEANVARGQFHISTVDGSAYHFDMRGTLQQAYRNGTPAGANTQLPDEVYRLKNQVVKGFEICP